MLIMCVKHLIHYGGTTLLQDIMVLTKLNQHYLMMLPYICNFFAKRFYKLLIKQEANRP